MAVPQYLLGSSRNDKTFENGLQRYATFSRTGFASFKLDPSFVEAIEHLDARQWVLHPL